MSLLRAGVIWVLMVVPCFAVDHKIEIANVGALCILESEHVGDWAGIVPATVELWTDPSGNHCAVPTDVAVRNKIIVECIMWDAKRRDRWFITIAGNPPKPDPDPVVPPKPPGPIVVPNKFGLGEISHREMLKIAGNVGQPTMIASLETASNELRGVTSVEQRDEVYARHRARMDAGLGQEWMPLRRAVQDAIFKSFADGKIKTFTDEADGVKEVADAIRLVK